jgi:nitroreductase
LELIPAHAPQITASIMDTLEAIRTRRSIRAYENKPVPADLVEQVIAAAMMAPSARNGQPWRFVIIDDRDLLNEIPEFHPYAKMVPSAALALLVCGDTTLERSPGYWPIDCAAATENLLLAAHALGLGAVWLGVYPRTPRMDGFRRMLRLPETVIPHTLIPLGYPAEQPVSEDRFRQDRIHHNRWE